MGSLHQGPWEASYAPACIVPVVATYRLNMVRLMWLLKKGWYRYIKLAWVSREKKIWLGKRYNGKIRPMHNRHSVYLKGILHWTLESCFHIALYSQAFLWAMYCPTHLYLNLSTSKFAWCHRFRVDFSEMMWMFSFDTAPSTTTVSNRTTGNETYHLWHYNHNNYHIM